MARPEKSVWTLGVGTLCVGDPRWRAGDAPAGPGTEQRLRHRAGSGHVPTFPCWDRSRPCSEAPAAAGTGTPGTLGLSPADAQRSAFGP